MTPIDEYDDAGPLTSEIKPLTTKGLILIPATPDIQDYSRWLNDPEVVKFSELRHRQHTFEECQEYVRKFDQIKNCMWTINVLGANVHIGNITSHYDPNNNLMEMGMLIGEKWAWGRKYGREAWQAVLDWGASEKIRRAEAGCMISNAGMRKVMRASGMSHVGGVDAHFLRDGKPEGLVIYARSLN